MKSEIARLEREEMAAWESAWRALNACSATLRVQRDIDVERNKAVSAMKRWEAVSAQLEAARKEVPE